MPSKNKQTKSKAKQTGQQKPQSLKGKTHTHPHKS
jgi:hypothetical protein